MFFHFVRKHAFFAHPVLSISLFFSSSVLSCRLVVGWPADRKRSSFSSSPGQNPLPFSSFLSFSRPPPPLCLLLHTRRRGMEWVGGDWGKEEEEGGRHLLKNGFLTGRKGREGEGAFEPRQQGRGAECDENPQTKKDEDDK